MSKLYVYDVVRVQGGDIDLVEALDNAAAESWELVQAIPTGGAASPSATADGSWCLILRRVAEST